MTFVTGEAMTASSRNRYKNIVYIVYYVVVDG